ncbi:heterokaryon incompatibility protein [Colletotrichum kahawae]|uniref:Heterokaryon incompatibility protein n=1 Tax=Colletotrichum kahawae TaxID=34407 RepID=A0AAE0CYK5_COLKA|nr:heterokaryon incompatibility protein [Colletotrichum kahawae]
MAANADPLQPGERALTYVRNLPGLVGLPENFYYTISVRYISDGGNPEAYSGPPGCCTFTLRPAEIHSPQARKIESQSTNVDEVFALASAWIKNCLEIHDQCDLGIGQSFTLPTRLIDCGDPESSSTQSCRLIETQQTPAAGPYMTLSHCWGKAHCLKLTQSNLAQLLAAIPTSTLPPLYQDAITITRSLGVRYLWIDSICIIQDEPQQTDWKKEVTRMGDVYANSMCNISALDCQDASYPIFRDRSAAALNSPVVETDVHGNGQTAHYLTRDDYAWHYEVVRSTVNSRAWVFQERLLSPRILNFGKNEVYWECRCLEASETRPRGFPGTSERRPFKGIIGPVGSPRLPLIPGWNDIVRTYTTAAITFPEDRPIAISGIAKMAARWYDDEYVAGLWRSNLANDLLWARSDNPASVPGGSAVKQGYTGPSWSWTSCTGPVEFFGNEFGDDMAKSVLFLVGETHMEGVGGDNINCGQGSWLSLWGQLKRMTSINVPGKPWWECDVSIGGKHIAVDPEDYMIETRFFCSGRRTRPDGSSLLYAGPPTPRARRGRIGVAGVFSGEVMDAIVNSSEDAGSLPCLEEKDGKQCIKVF